MLIKGYTSKYKLRKFKREGVVPGVVNNTFLNYICPVYYLESDIVSKIKINDDTYLVNLTNFYENPYISNKDKQIKR